MQSNDGGAPTAVRMGDIVFSLEEVLRHEHRQRRLVPRLRDAACELFLLAQARAMQCAVTDDELQKAADHFRRRDHLVSADQTHAWLQDSGLTVDDFEAGLETRLLLRKVRDRIAAERVPSRFEARRSDFDRLSLRLIQVPQEDVAREIRTQIAEEGAAFAEFARSHSVHASREADGLLEPTFRCRLPKSLREALATATVGELVGPVSDPEGFVLAKLEAIEPAQLDAETASWIARHVIEEWLEEQWQANPLTLPILDRLR